MKTTDERPPPVSDQEERGGTAVAALGRPRSTRGRGHGGFGPIGGLGRVHRRTGRPDSLRAARKKVNDSVFFLLSFLYLFIFQNLFQIKFSMPKQNKINPHHKIK
jgi:hypothetical protein